MTAGAGRPPLISRLRVGRKLLLLVMLPLGGLLLFTVLSFLDQLRTADSLRDFRTASRVSFATAGLADALAGERTATVLLRLRPGADRRRGMNAERAATDRAMERAGRSAAAGTGTGQDVRGDLATARTGLWALRVQVSAGSLTTRQITDQYSSLIGDLLATVGRLDSGRPAEAAGRAADAYLAILAAIEAAEHERADLAVVFAAPAGRRPATASPWENLEAAELAAFKQNAAQPLGAELEVVLHRPAGRQVSGLRDDLAADPERAAGRTTPTRWLDMSGDRVDGLRGLERRAAAQLEAAAGRDLAANRARRGRDLGLSAAVLVVVIGSAVALARSISRPLAEVSRSARTLSGGDLTAEVRYTGHDEIGDVAEAFRELRVTAGRLAGEIRDMNTAITGSRLGHRADVAAFEGSWAQLLEGMNGTMAAFAGLHGQRRRAERGLEDIFNLSRDLLSISGLDGCFTRVNPAFERTLGYSCQELLARPYTDFVHPDDLERTTEALVRLAGGEEIVRFENRCLRRDGTVCRLEWSARPVLDEGLIYSAARDVTARRRTERELARSRARVVAAADEARRRIERDLHDGVQQRLVCLGLELDTARGMVTDNQLELRAQLAHTAKGLSGALEDLLEISRGIHPGILSRGGLGPALRTLARRSAVPVEFEQGPSAVRLPDGVEVAAYYVVSEALTNAAKHARAGLVRIRLETGGAELRLVVHDDGVGGAEPGRGSGLIGLTDRVEALGGTIRIDSPAGGGTTLAVTLPAATR